MNNKTKRLPPNIHNHIYYVEMEKVEKFHGKKWFKKFSIGAGANTCPVIPNKGVCMYFHDYERFADLVDFNKPTYWD